LDTPTVGPYFTEVKLEHQGRLVFVGRRGLVIDYPDEFRTRPTDHELLENIAEVTGGLYDPEPQAIFAPSDETAPRTTCLWPYLLAAAAVIFTIDVAVRRTRRAA
jgi:hypothetical protein